MYYLGTKHENNRFMQVVRGKLLRRISNISSVIHFIYKVFNLKKVMVFGSFDLLHEGHKFFLNEAKKQGDFLVVVVGRDFTIKKIKNEFPFENETLRLKKLKELKIADKIILGDEKNFLIPILNEKPNVICLGYDQNSFTSNLKEKLINNNLDIEIIRLNAYKPDHYKSSIIKKYIK
jgi:FAD synthetase